MRRKFLAAGIFLATALAAGIFAYSRWFAAGGDSRESLLLSLPADATAVIYADVAGLRQSGILNSIGDLSSKVVSDADYKQFVSETGFEYEKDLDRVGIAIKDDGGKRTLFALADGKFDRRKIETYLRKGAVSEKKGSVEIFHLAEPNPGPNLSSVQQWISVAFLSDHRIVFFDGSDLNAQLEAANRSAGRSEWTERFARLAGSPVFALMRQDAAIGGLLNNQAPGGIRSPQLIEVVNRLLWVSIAGKFEGKELRIVLEGECPNEATMRQLSDFLNGIVLMANAGLNDPKLRQQMDPAEREAYQQLLNSSDVMKLDRGKSKAVRVTFVVTPEIWSKLEQSASLQKPAEQKDSANSQANPGPTKNKNGGPKQPARHP